MARLIPSFMDENIPPGERAVFNMIAGGPEDWVALHSLDLAPWNRGCRTEIDFVVFVPDTGILCIEVKSQTKISFDGNRWHPDSITRSPFKQAVDGRYTFYRRLKDSAPQFKDVPVVHCCIFPRSWFEMDPNLSVLSRELMDRPAFNSFSSSGEFCNNLQTRMLEAVDADPVLQLLSRSLSKVDIDVIVELCVPMQKFRPDAREEILRREEEVELLLRKQQKPVLQLAAQNDRLIVQGGAGTGKTLIAMELARRAAEKGERVGLVCFNQHIGDWLCERMQQVNPPLPNLVVGRAIKIMAEMAEINIPDKAPQEFWERELPQRLEERLTDPEFKGAAVFDRLIIDEAQDILARPAVWNCLVQFLLGGMEHGRFTLFGDFENQVLADAAIMESTLEGLRGAVHCTNWTLDENCRNLPTIGETAVKLSGLGRRVYSGYLRVGGGADDLAIAYYDGQDDQLRQLSEWLREFKNLKFKPGEVTVLSFCSPEKSVAAKLATTGFKLKPLWQAGNSTGYASIHAFKGMENKAVIITDIVLSDEGFHRDLFYTGMTRSTGAVRILCSADSKDKLAEWLTESID